MDDTDTGPTVLLITPPDFYMDNGNARLLSLGTGKFQYEINEGIVKMWTEDVNVFSSDFKGEDIGWLVYQIPLVDAIFFEISEATPAWALALLLDYKGPIYYVIDPALGNDFLMGRTLKLRHSKQIFETAFEAVISAQARTRL